MTEVQIIQWFASHPFTQHLCLAALSGVSPMVVIDYNSLKEHRKGDSTATFSIRVALRKYMFGAFFAIAPILGAEIVHVIGGIV